MPERDLPKAALHASSVAASTAPGAKSTPTTSPAADDLRGQERDVAAPTADVEHPLPAAIWPARRNPAVIGSTRLAWTASRRSSLSV